MKTVGTVRIEGLSQLADTMRELPKATQKNVLKRVLMKRGQPLATAMRNLAPDDPRTPNTKDLKGSIGVGTKLTPRQSRLHKKETKNDKQFAEVFVGAGKVPHAHLNEWGTINMAAQPFARPAWDENKDAILDGIKDDLWTEIDRAAKRHARKLAKGK